MTLHSVTPEDSHTPLCTSQSRFVFRIGTLNKPSLLLPKADPGGHSALHSMAREMGTPRRGSVISRLSVPKQVNKTSQNSYRKTVATQ